MCGKMESSRGKGEDQHEVMRICCVISRTLNKVSRGGNAPGRSNGGLMAIYSLFFLLECKLYVMN